MSTFILDGRYIQDHFPGIGRYLFNLANALARVAPDDRFRILHNPRLRNTRFNVESLARHRNLELMRTDAGTFSIREQFLGASRALTANAALWHAGYYVKPYRLPMPSVVTLEDLIPLVWREEMPNASRRLLYRVLNLLAAHTSVQVITLSQAARADLVRVLGVSSKKISVVPLAADARFHPTSAAEIARVRAELQLPESYVLYVGINKPHKNLVRLVNAWSQVRANACLVIAGAWDARYPEAQVRVQTLGVENRVLFRHDVSNPDLPALISGARAFVFPSLHEGFGLPPLEAMACGTPVACAKTSSLPEVVGDAALLFDPRDESSIATALTRVLEDSALRETLHKKGLARARQFSWERTARETLNVYRKVIG